MHALPGERGPRRRRHLGPHLLLLRLDLREFRTKAAQVRLQSRRLGGGLHARRNELGCRLTHVVIGDLGVLHETQLSLFLVRQARLHVLHLFRHLHQLSRVADAPAHELTFTRTELGAVILSRAIRFMQPSRRSLLRRAGSRDLLFEPDHFGIRLQQRFDPLDVVAQHPLAIHEALVLEQELSWFRHRLRFRRSFGADVEADAMAGRGAVLGDRHLAEPRLVCSHVLGQQLRQQLHMVGAHAHPAVNAHEPRILGRPLAEIEHEPERVAVDEHRIGVNDLTRTVLNLDTDRKLAHSSTTNTWPSLTTSASLTRISRTVPARGAVTEISIFIDSRIRSTSSSATLSPGLAVIFQTLPTSSALTSVTRLQAQLRSRLSDRRHPVPEVTAQPRRLFHQLTIAASHPSLLQVEVVLETDANVAAHRDRRRDEWPLVEPDADDLPVRSRRQAVDLVDQVTSRAGNAAQHSHDEAELQRRFEHAHVDERPRVADVARVKALHLGPHAGGVHGLEEELDVMKRVGEDVIVIEDLPLLGVDRVVHRAHVQGGHLRFEVANVGDAFLRWDADGAGREVDDRVGARANFGEDLGESLHAPVRPTVRFARMDVHDRRACFGGALGLLGDLHWRVRDGGALLAGREHTRERGRDDGLAQTGMFPCLRHGRSTFLSRACSRPRTITRRVSAGSMTSSIIAQPAAMYGLICARIASNIRERVSSGLSEASICLLKMMFTAPSGPMTEISANGHATSTSGW